MYFPGLKINLTFINQQLLNLSKVKIYTKFIHVFNCQLNISLNHIKA